MSVYYEFFWYFSIYAFLGWCAEVVFATLKTGKFVNRGFLNGPVCPIYGFGAVLVIACLTPIMDNVFILFIGSVFLTTLLEGITGFVLEKLFHTMWWDYSEEPFNFKGYICARFSILWGFGCILIMDVFHPIVINLVELIPLTVGNVILAIILLIFISDCIITVAAILKFNKYLEQLDEMSVHMKELSDEIGKVLSDKTLEAVELSSELLEKANEIKENIEDKKEKLEQTKAEYEQLLHSKAANSRLLRAFPNLKSKSHNRILQNLKEYYKERRS